MSEDSRGQCEAEREFTHHFLVCSLPTKAAGLLVTDLLDRLGAKIDFESREMSVSDRLGTS
jgi:hypothetical protein